MKTREYSYLVLWAVGMTLLLVNGSGASRVKLVNNGYEGVVVAISQEVDESLGPAIIQSIKKMITEASKNLYQATNDRLYFRKVKILVPKSWGTTQVDKSAVNEDFEESEIRVDHMHPVYKNQPYTHQPGGCGDPGKYIHFTPEYLTKMSEAAWWGPRGTVLLMEWAKLRWGVFDEIGYPGDKIFPLFYFLKDRDEEERKFQPTYCSEKSIKGHTIDKKRCGECRMNNQGEPDENCRFLAYKGQTDVPSLLSQPIIYNESVVHFCGRGHGTHKHNSEAPTKQNFFCDGRSVWEVMQDHQDFNGNNPQKSIYVEPVIELVQHADAHYALVLDYSGSMDTHSRIQKLEKTVRRWLLQEISEGSYVAIIKFTDTANLAHSLTKITNDKIRKTLADTVDTKAGGGTKIGTGLNLAVNVLNKVANPVILLLTDGEDGATSLLEEAMEKVRKSGIRVVTVAFGPKADSRLEQIALETGGKTFTVNDVDEGLMLENAFESALTYQPPPSKFDTTVLLHEDVHSGREKEIGGKFNIDFSIGRNLKLRLDNIKNPQQSVTKNPFLISPNGSFVEGAQFDSSTSSWTLTVSLAEEGQWQWKVGVSDSKDNPVTAKVTAQTRDKDIHPLITKAWVSSGGRDISAKKEKIIIYVEVKQGNNPVVNANVSALVTPPKESDPLEIYHLLDNGQGADTQAGDGIYSRYVTKFYGPGRYSLKAQVSDGGQSVINKGFITATSRKRSPDCHKDRFERPEYCCGSVIPLDPDNAPCTGVFSRVAVGGSFKIVDDVPPKDSKGNVVDLFPPSRVKDFQVSLIDPSNSHLSTHKISLSWTATGEDLDAGTASGYLVRMSKNAKDLIEANFGHDPSDPRFLIDVKSPKFLVKFGTKIQLITTVNMDLKSGDSYNFALRAIDKSGLISPVSNIVTIHEPVPLEFTGQTFLGIPILTIIIIIIILILLIMICVVSMVIYRKTYGSYESL